MYTESKKVNYETLLIEIKIEQNPFSAKHKSMEVTPKQKWKRPRLYTKTESCNRGFNNNKNNDNDNNNTDNDNDINNNNRAITTTKKQDRL